MKPPNRSRQWSHLSSLIACASLFACHAASAGIVTLTNTGYSISFDSSVFGSQYGGSGTSSVIWSSLYSAYSAPGNLLEGDAIEVAGSISFPNVAKSASFTDAGYFNITPTSGNKIDSITFTLQLGGSLNSGYELLVRNTNGLQSQATAIWSVASQATAVDVSSPAALVYDTTSVTSSNHGSVTSYTGGASTTTLYNNENPYKFLFTQGAFDSASLSRDAIGSATYVATQSLFANTFDADGNFLATVAGWGDGLDLAISLDASVSASGFSSAALAFNSFKIDVATSPIAPSIATPPTAPVPEPETYAMLLAGLATMGAVARRRKMTT